MIFFVSRLPHRLFPFRKRSMPSLVTKPLVGQMQLCALDCVSYKAICNFLNRLRKVDV